MPADTLRIGYIIGTYPLLTTRFIDREVALLRRQGVRLEILSLRPPHGELSGDQQALRDGVSYLLPIPPARLVTAHLRFAIRPGFWRALAWLVTRPHPSMRARLKTVLHFGEGVAAAHVLAPRALDRIHAHFVDRAAVVAMVVGRLLGLPYSLTGHANDIYVNPVMLREKVADADFVATCTGYNRDHLIAQLGAVAESKVVLAHHGIDLTGYQPSRRHPASPALILSIGQLKEKKGFGDLLRACRLLADRGEEFCCEIVGEGPLRPVLERQINDLGLADVVRLSGALPHDEVVAAYRRATLFVLPCVVASDGDRDGIPNVILEAMAMGLPVVSTRHSGIPEAVADGVTGLLVEPGDVAALAEAIEDVLSSEDSGAGLGAAGCAVVTERFDVEANAMRMLELFRA